MVGGSGYTKVQTQKWVTSDKEGNSSSNHQATPPLTVHSSSPDPAQHHLLPLDPIWCLICLYHQPLLFSVPKYQPCSVSSESSHPFHDCYKLLVSVLR